MNWLFIDITINVTKISIHDCIWISFLFITRWTTLSLNKLSIETSWNQAVSLFIKPIVAYMQKNFTLYDFLQSEFNSTKFIKEVLYSIVKGCCCKWTWLNCAWPNLATSIAMCCELCWILEFSKRSYKSTEDCNFMLYVYYLCGRRYLIFVTLKLLFLESFQIVEKKISKVIFVEQLTNRSLMMHKNICRFAFMN